MPVSKRTVAAVVVIVGWGSSLLWLGLRQSTQSDSALIRTQASLRLAPDDAWFSVVAGSTQIGYAGITLDTLNGGGYRIQEQIALELPQDASLVRTIRSTEVWLNSALAVDSLVSRSSRPGESRVYRAWADGAGWRTEATYNGELVGAGQLAFTPRDRAPTTTPILQQVVPLRLALVGALGTGAGRTLPLVGGWPAAGWSTEVVLQGDSTAVFADSSEFDEATARWVGVTFDTAQGRGVILESPAAATWQLIDRRGTVVGAEYPFGVTWVREEFNVARFNFRDRLDSLAPGIRAALPVVVRQRDPIPTHQPAAMAQWQVTRRDGSAIPFDLLVTLTGGRQHLSAGRLRVNDVTAFGTRLGRLTPVDPFVQSADTAVVTLAAAAADAIARDGAAGAVQAVGARVRPSDDPRAAIDAVRALASGRAQPEGMARLVAAVLQHHGHTARVAFGVRPVGDTMYTHAWVESLAPSGGSWRATDPLTGHPMPVEWIRIGYAGSARPDELTPILADVRFTPVPDSAGTGATP